MSGAQMEALTHTQAQAQMLSPTLYDLFRVLLVQRGSDVTTTTDDDDGRHPQTN